MKILNLLNVILKHSSTPQHLLGLRKFIFKYLWLKSFPHENRYLRHTKHAK